MIIRYKLLAFKLVSMLLVGFLFTNSLRGAERILVGVSAKDAVFGASMVRYKDGFTLPTYVQFQTEQGPNFNDFDSWLSETYCSNTDFSFEHQAVEVDPLGWKIYRLQQLYKGVPIEYAIINVQVKNEKVISHSGYLVESVAQEGFEISKQEIVNEAQSYVEEHIGTKDLSLTAVKSIEKRFVSLEHGFKSMNIKSAWKLELLSLSPLVRTDIFIDALTGDIIGSFDKLFEIDSVGLANTVYSGNRAITTDYDSINNIFRLQESGRGNGIKTLDGWNVPVINDFIDSNNNWIDTGRNRYAADAHWGAERGYDYFLNVHGRNSIDNSGFTLVNHIVWGIVGASASWFGGVGMLYFVSPSASYTMLDICGHELTHGLTEKTANLVYSKESGALNESFSDIFGSVIEMRTKPDSIKNWLIAEDYATGFGGIRSLNDPNSRNDPDTYKGNFWHTSPSDYYGVHTNSGVQNFWFYLLTEGGSGINDNGDFYNVTGLGHVKSEKIAYRNLTVYLSPYSDYEDARFFSIVSAIDLYGKCSQELESTIRSWYAVGIGDNYVQGVNSEFSVAEDKACSNPATFYFENKSNYYNIDSYYWDFGDGTNSNDPDPIHIYSSLGKYSVSLKVDGGVCGIDSTLKNDLISISKPSDVKLNDTTVCYDDSFYLSAGFEDELYWYSGDKSTNPIWKGNGLYVSNLNNDTVFYAENVILKDYGNVGMTDTMNDVSEAGDGSFLLFDAYREFVLKSVKVYSANSDYRKIILKSNTGIILDSLKVFTNMGVQRINLDFLIPPGEDYLIGISPNLPNRFLYTKSGTSFPYEVDSVVSIKSGINSYETSDSYFFFYDWKIEGMACHGNRYPINVFVDHSLNCGTIYQGEKELRDNNQLTLYPNPVSTHITITGPVKEQVKIVIYNSLLELVFTKYLILNGSTTFELPSNLASGVYSLVIELENRVQVEQIIVRK